MNIRSDNDKRGINGQYHRNPQHHTRKAKNYPQYAYLLHQAGIQHYRVELPAHTIIYSGRDESDKAVVVGEAIHDAGQNLFAFNESGVIAALRANQEGRTDFETFLKDIWAAGITHYIADLSARIVTYYATDGQTYAEEYPLAVVD